MDIGGGFSRIKGIAGPTPVEVGQIFHTTGALREAVSKELTFSGHRVKSSKNSGSRQKGYVCYNCPKTWIVRATKQFDDTWKVSSTNKQHVNCTAGGQRTPGHIVQPMVKELVGANPKISGPAIKRAMTDAGFHVSERSAQRVKRRCLTQTEIEWKEAIARLPSFLEAVEAGCPGSVAKYESSGNGENRRLTRTFLMLGSAAHVAANSAPRVLGLNAGRLKGLWNGVSIVLAAKDSNNKIIVVATALVDKENEDNYVFFLENCMKNAEFSTFLDSPHTTVYMDGHKGSAAAVRRVVSLASVRRCARHMITGPSLFRMGTVYNAAKAPSAELFNENLKALKNAKPDDHAALMKTDVVFWTDHAKPRYNLAIDPVASSNPVERSLHSTEEEALALNPLRLHEAVALRTAKRQAEFAGMRSKSSVKFTPYAASMIDAEMKKSLALSVTPEGTGIFLVKKHDDSTYANRVDVMIPHAEDEACTMYCTCGVPERSGLPCCDVLAALRCNIDKVDKLVHKGYKLGVYKELYGNSDFEVRLPTWSELEEESLLPPLPVDGQAGAPKKGHHKKALIPGIMGDNNQYPIPDCSVKTRPVLPVVSDGDPPAATTQPVAKAGAASAEIPQPTFRGAPARKHSIRKQRVEQRKTRKGAARTGAPSPSAGAKPSKTQSSISSSASSRDCVDLSQE